MALIKGAGKTTVVFLSTPVSTKDCRLRSCRARGWVGGVPEGGRRDGLAVGGDDLRPLLPLGLTCIIFIVVILGGLLNVVIGVNIFKLMRYLGREFLIIFSTSSSQAGLPRLIAKMEHLGVSKPVVGVTVPTSFPFNLDGTALYLTMASLFISTALGKPLNLGEQIRLLVCMMIASKGAARVPGPRRLTKPPASNMSRCSNALHGTFTEEASEALESENDLCAETR
ncbi:MAG: aerobic C4-dicarboxylate transport protein [Actinomycetota bacterium]|nr:aerobic C4-dicarboxylate transport protein [Actinomycetota bacterium]